MLIGMLREAEREPRCEPYSARDTPGRSLDAMTQEDPGWRPKWYL